MSDIFLSYSSKDVERAKQLAEALTRQGWTVWWDRTILPGKIFDRVIEAELAATRCVIVLWSIDSVESSWVRAEAEVAMKKGHLIPALLGEVNIPLVFRQFQAASLSDWDGDDNHAGFQQLLHAISALLPRPDGITKAAALRSAPVTAQQQSRLPEQPVSADPEDMLAAGNSPTRPDQQPHNYLNRAAWILVFMLAGALVYFNLYPKDRADSPVLTQEPAPPQTPRPLHIEPSASKQKEPAQADQAVHAAQDAGQPQPDITPVPPTPAEPTKTQQAPPAPIPTKPSTLKPAPVVQGTARDVTQKPSAPPTHASSTPPPMPVEPVAPLTILAVTWAMPSDKGVASTARIQDFSDKVSKTMTTVMQTVLHRPVDFKYHYPSQQEHYRLLKDKDGYVESQALCKANNVNLVVSGFIQGAKFVSASYGYELTRDPVFSVFDCKAGKKISHSYTIAESNQDNFPYEISIRNTFREFAEHKAALNNY